MVLIIFGLVVPMSVLTQLLSATLWKAFCFRNEIQCEGRQCLTLTYKLRDIAFGGVRNKSWTLSSACPFSCFYFFTHHHTNRGILPLLFLVLCLWLTDANTPASPTYSSSSCFLVLALGTLYSAFHPMWLKREMGRWVKKVAATLVTCYDISTSDSHHCLKRPFTDHIHSLYVGFSRILSSTF